MKKLIAMSLTVLLLCGLSTNAFSYYVYRDGHYYRDAGWWSLGGFVTGLAVGAYVASLPPEYETVVINGVPYYYADGYYYQTSPNGYVVVEPPGHRHGVIMYVLGILLAVVLALCIVILLKKIVAR